MRNWRGGGGRILIENREDEPRAFLECLCPLVAFFVVGAVILVLAWEMSAVFDFAPSLLNEL